MYKSGSRGLLLDAEVYHLARHLPCSVHTSAPSHSLSQQPIAPLQRLFPRKRDSRLTVPYSIALLGSLRTSPSPRVSRVRGSDLVQTILALCLVSVHADPGPLVQTRTDFYVDLSVQFRSNLSTPSPFRRLPEPTVRPNVKHDDRRPSVQPKIPSRRR